MAKGRFAALAAGVAAVALILAGCSATPQPAESNKDPYRVLVLGGIGVSGNARTSVIAAQASAAEINKSGGILGREVIVTVANDNSTGTDAVTRVQEAINSDTPPDLILNSGPSAVAEATLSIINAAGILSMNIGPTATSADPTKFPLNFDLSPGVPEYLLGFVAQIKAKSYKTVGILHGSSAYGKTFGSTAESTFKSSGFTVTKNEEYDVAALDMTAQLQSIKDTKPDVLVLDAYGAPLGYVLAGLQKLNWTVPIIGNNSVAASPAAGKLPPDGYVGTATAANVLMEVFRSTKYDAADTAVVTAVANMLRFGPIEASLILAYNYDSLFLVRAAANKVGSADDPAKLAKALEDTTVTAGAGTVMLKKYQFTDKSHSPNISGDEFSFIPFGVLKDGQYR